VVQYILVKTSKLNWAEIRSH